MQDLATVDVLVLGTAERMLYMGMTPEEALVCAAMYKAKQCQDLHDNTRKAELRSRIYYGGSGRTAFLDYNGNTFGVRLARS